LPTKRIFVIAGIVLAVLIAEFLILEGTIGISVPSERNSALSTLEIRDQGRELHFITRNKRFTVVDFWTDHGTRRQALVLRESFFMDRKDSVEGPPDAAVTVEALRGKNVSWTIHEPGERGDAVTNNLYKVTKHSNGETPNIYTYFSLADGRKVHTNESVELSRDELEALDVSVAKGH
jgi:hypothetical protein